MKKIFTLISIIVALNLAAQPAGWLYNQPITVTNPNAQAGVDYQLKITVNTQSLISAGKMNSSGNDIRFGGTCTSSTFFNYWIEGGINTTTTAIWVKIPLIAANSSTTIFMYYGNPSALATSTIPGTFRGPNSATDSISGGSTNLTPGACQRGFRFAPTQNLLVTHFGKNEPNGTTRYVTLFNYSTQAIISQTQVPGPSATYTYGPISSPVWLSSGTQYVLQIYQTSSDGYYYQGSSQIGQHLTYFDMQYSNGGTQNTFPNTTLANYHYGYGDFLYYITNTLATTPTYTYSQLASITTPSAAICSGGSTTLTTNASGSFTWNTGSTASSIIVSPTTNTIYTVSQGTSGICSIAAISISVSGSAPVLSVSTSTNQTCLGKTVTLTATGALTYSWTGGVINGLTYSPTATSSYTVVGQNGCGTGSAVTTITVAPIAVTAITTPTLVCAGSTATLTAAGAATGYTWAPSNLTGATAVVSPNTTTIYTVTASDGTCSGVATVTLAANPVPTLNISTSSSVICQGDQVNLTATGAISYTWSPGGSTGSSLTSSPLAPTLFSVVGSNSFGCTSPMTQIVLVNPTPTVNVASLHTLVCSGGSSTLTASGGANTYSWNTGPSLASIIVNPTQTTTYSVTGTYTNTNCHSTTPITISVFIPTISVSPVTTSACIGAVVTVTASGGNSYNWSPSGGPFAIATLSANISEVYTVSAMSATTGALSCPGSATMQLIVNQNPTVTASSTRTVICKGEKTILTAGGAGTYTWNTNATTSTLQVNPTSGSPVYTVQGKDANGCVNSATIQVKVNPCTGINELNAKESIGLKVYPNPNNGDFIIESGVDIELQLINELGQTIKTLHLADQNNHRISVNDLAKGIYFLVGQKNDLKLNQKLVVIR